MKASPANGGGKLAAPALHSWVGSNLVARHCAPFAVIALVALSAAAASPRAAVASPRARAAAPIFANGDGLDVVSATQLDRRLFAVTVSTRALYGQAKIRILLPADYSLSRNRHRRYPVLYLLPGTGGAASDWTQLGGAEQTTAGLPMIVVMPDIAINNDGGGWCANWFNRQVEGAHDWDTFHIGELIPWIDQNLRTRANRAGRAIAGLSQGGFCSTSYAARYPDLFGVSLSYSGAPDIAYDPAARSPSTSIINFIETAYDHVPANSIFGPRTTEEVNWADHDPATLALNLRATRLLLYSGNGHRGPLDTQPPSPLATVIETLVGQDTAAFHRRLQQLGIPSLYDAYGPGTHSFPYWARDLKLSIAAIADDFAHPPPPPSRVTYTIADPRYSVFGWQVSLHRKAEEFSTLQRADARGFALLGSGSATVVTPAYYRRGALYSVTLRGRSASETVPLRADHAGRLRIGVPLGPSNRYQQYTAAAETVGTKVYETNVEIVAAA